MCPRLVLRELGRTDTVSRGSLRRSGRPRDGRRRARVPDRMLPLHAAAVLIRFHLGVLRADRLAFGRLRVILRGKSHDDILAVVDETMPRDSKRSPAADRTRRDGITSD